MTKNKFAVPPYLPEYDSLKAVKLGHLLRLLSKTCLQFQNCDGALEDIDLLIARPSMIRQCDLYRLKPLIEAINKLE